MASSEVQVKRMHPTNLKFSSASQDKHVKDLDNQQRTKRTVSAISELNSSLEESKHHSSSSKAKETNPTSDINVIAASTMVKASEVIVKKQASGTNTDGDVTDLSYSIINES
jgi:hypothetical protein